MSEHRRLAAILVADVVGYSKLVGSDEAGTLAKLEALRAKIIDPTIGKHSGRLFKAVGDGFLVEFASAVQAVEAARAIQQANVEGELRLRIGIHVGDVVVQGDDLMGDGVNVAARVEGVADPGGIAISRQVRDQVRDKLDVALIDKGEVELKNIARPVRVFLVSGAKAVARADVLALPDKPSIAVLPFQNMSGDPEQEYFADGIVEDIITALSRFKSLFVIARNSSFTYKGKAVDVRQVGRELGVRYVLEGSVRKAGGQIRITGQLIEAASGEHLWAERYDRNLSDVFTLQDEITVRIATAVDPAIRDAQTKAALRKHPTDLGAWDQVLRGLWHLNHFRQAANEEGRREFLAAIERDPGSAPAHATLAMSHVFDAWFNWTEAHAASLEQAHKAAALAVKLDPQEPLAHVASALACFWTGRMEQAKSAAGLAISLNPNSFLANYTCGAARNYLGECEAAVPYHLKALDLSPNDPFAWNCLGSLAHTYFNLGKFNDAVDCANRAIVLRHGYLFGRVVKTAALGHEGRRDEAAASLRAIFDISPDFSLRKLEHYPFILDSQRKHLFAGLEKAGLPTKPTMNSPPAPALALPDKPSIAVLPFQNMSGDPEQEYFADGIVEDIITALSRFKSLFVIARNSSFAYKGKAIDIRQIGRELGVHYVLEGSVRKAGSRVRITGQLIATETGAHLWADRFEGAIEDVFKLQDEVTEKVIAAIAPSVEHAEIERAHRKPTANLSAHDCYLRASAWWRDPRRGSTDEAMRLLRRALEIDPGHSSAMGLLLAVYANRKGMGLVSDAERENAEVELLVRQAVSIGRDDAVALGHTAWAIAYVLRDLTFAEEQIKRALMLNPNLAIAWTFIGWIHLWSGNPAEAVEDLSHGARLDPLNDTGGRSSALAHAYFFLDRHEDALRVAESLLQRIPEAHPLLRVGAASAAFAGQMDVAQKFASRLKLLDPAFRVSRLEDYLGPYRPTEFREKYKQGLGKAGLPE